MINRSLKIIILSSVLITLICASFCFFIEPLCAFVCMLLGASLTAVFVLCTKKRYDKLNELNNYLSAICAGNYELDIADNAEGELSVLKNNLYKVISILRSQNEMHQRDKTYLADALADISHQLKTPLTSMTVMTDLLKTEKNSDRIREFVDITERQLDKMKWLITNLLKISKLDAGTAIFHTEKISSAELVAAATEPFMISLELKNISLNNSVAEFMLNIDKNWTAEALQNIIKNCIEHTANGGMLTLSSQNTGVYYMIRIADNGHGIAQSDLPHIFERFYHGKNSSKESAGIGLALAKSILEKENAEIHVSSKENVGTVFEIKFYKGII